MKTVLPQGHPFLGDGEIHFLWWFIQGSIMDPEMRDHLRRAWGFCARHGLGYLAVDTAYRHGFVHGPAILYDDIMERAAKALAVRGPLAARRAALNLRTAGPCPLCDLSLRPATGSGSFSGELLAQGRDLIELRRFAAESHAGWRPHVCGVCAADDRPGRCRAHLHEAIAAGDEVALVRGRATVRTIGAGVAAFHRSFRWEERDTVTAVDRGSLLAAIGWCGGWEEILAWL
ncbi:MAG TPA: hypothetical protein VFW92_11145 [Candidatus Limnocylindrales bacterium]|nr:hypothetical protein [Candidatus Limnocylindrales bacterium]